MAALLAKVGPQNQGTPPAGEHILWPCNVQTWLHWQNVQTQWRTGGMGAPAGLDYAGVRAYLDERHLPPPEREHIFDCITACERATLRAWSEKAEAKKSGA